MKPIAVLTLVAALLWAMTSCSPKPSGSPAASQGSAGAEAVQGTIEETVEIGDVEQSVLLSLTLASTLTGPNIRQELLRDPRQIINLARVSVKPPFPKELPILLTISSMRTFPDTPVVLRVRAFADERPVGVFAAIAGRHDTGNRDVLWTFDPLKDVPAFPDTMLVRVEADALLMPAGTDPGSIDLQTATTSPERVTKLIGNPLRIQFHGNGAPEAPAAS